MGDYYNVSEKSGRMRAGGVPFGFTHREVPGYDKGFPVFLDIAATRGATANLVQYLKEGLFIDPLTCWSSPSTTRGTSPVGLCVALNDAHWSATYREPMT